MTDLVEQPERGDLAGRTRRRAGLRAASFIRSASGPDRGDVGDREVAADARAGRRRRRTARAPRAGRGNRAGGARPALRRPVPPRRPSPKDGTRPMAPSGGRHLGRAAVGHVLDGAPQQLEARRVELVASTAGSGPRRASAVEPGGQRLARHQDEVGRLGRRPSAASVVADERRHDLDARRPGQLAASRGCCPTPRSEAQTRPTREPARQPGDLVDELDVAGPDEHRHDRDAAGDQRPGPRRRGTWSSRRGRSGSGRGARAGRRGARPRPRSGPGTRRPGARRRSRRRRWCTRRTGRGRAGPGRLRSVAAANVAAATSSAVNPAWAARRSISETMPASASAPRRWGGRSATCVPAP